MIDNERKIKDIYNCNYIKTDKEIYPLQKWYNQLIDKKYYEIDLKDVLKMIRQNEFIDLAVLKAICYLKENPFIGELYEGELIECLLKVDRSKIKPYIAELNNILSVALELNKNYEWLIEEERLEFEETINLIKNMF